MSIFSILPTFEQAPWSYILVPLIVSSSVVGFYYKPYFYALVLHPYEIYRGKRWHSLLTSAFIHRNWLHLLFNVLMIYGLLFDLFGCLKQEYSQKTAVLLSPILIFILILLPNLVQSHHKKEDFMFTTMGASGLTFGLFGFSGLFFPMESIEQFIIPFVSSFLHRWFFLLFLLFLFTLLKRRNLVNVYLHLYAYIIGGVVALCTRPTSIMEIYSYLFGISQ